MIFSNTTLEHIPQPMIRKLLLEGKRLLKPNGLMAHLIDPSDHFAHSDPRISPINFLKYSEKEFSRYNNSFCWQNRLRTYEYKALFIDCGFRILTWDTKPNEKSLSAIKSIRLDEKFSNLPKEEICSGSICAVVQKLDN